MVATEFYVLFLFTRGGDFLKRGGFQKKSCNNDI